MSGPTGIQKKMYDRMKVRPEFNECVTQVTDAFISKSDSIADEVMQTFCEETHVFAIAKNLFSKWNMAKIDRTTAQVEIDDDLITSSAPLDDHLDFMGVNVDIPTAGMTLEEALDKVKFLYQLRADDPPAAAAAASAAASASAGAASGVAGSSSSAIDLIDEDEDEDPVPPSEASAKGKADATMINRAVPSDASASTTAHPSVVGSPVVGGKAKAVADAKVLSVTLGSLAKKRIRVSDTAVFKNEFKRTLNHFSLKELKVVAGHIGVDKNQNKPELVHDIATEICQLAANKLNNGTV